MPQHRFRLIAALAFAVGAAAPANAQLKIYGNTTTRGRGRRRNQRRDAGFAAVGRSLRLAHDPHGLHTTAAKLADPAKRREIVAFVRAVVRASERIRTRPAEVWPLVAQRAGYDPALIEKVWHHEGYPGALVPDLLDVMAEEDVFLAPERNRAPRSRAELALLIDASILREALAD